MPFQWQLAVILQGVGVRGQGPGHAAGQRPHFARARIGFSIMQKHIAASGRRRHFSAIDRHGFAIGQMNHQKTPAANAAVVTIDHPQSKAGGNRAVDGVSAMLDGGHRRISGSRIDRSRCQTICPTKIQGVNKKTNGKNGSHGQYFARKSTKIKLLN